MPTNRDLQHPGFQGVVRAYDVEHWQHAHGSDSIRHTILHLQAALSRILVPNTTRHRSVNLKEWNELPGRLLEHAARLANNLNATVLIACAPTREISFVIVGRGFQRIAEFERGRAPRGRREILEALATINADLTEVWTALEQIDHGVGRTRFRQVFCDAVATLLEFAYALGPLGKTTRAVAKTSEGAGLRFLSPLTRRMLELRRRKERSSAA